MTSTIVTIGDEILIGQVTDTNSAFIAKALNNIGVEVVEMLSISDERDHILRTFQRLQDTVDLVIITGGLGPTKDDITKKTFCDYFDDQLVRNDRVLAHVTALIEKFYKRSITQLNIDQALVPSKCEVLFNEYGTAPGMWMHYHKTVFISLPGVPFEMKHLMETSVVPKIVKAFERPYILHKTILTYGQGESMVEERIEKWEDRLPSFVRLAYLPSPGRVRLRLSARGTDQKALEQEIEKQVGELTLIIGDIIVGFDEDGTIEQATGKLLTAHYFTLAVAESCTGGRLSQMITSVPGSSAYFKGGLVCYSAEMKTKLLGVSQATIDGFSVVSAEVATEMSERARELMRTDFGVGITGNAGPTKDEGTTVNAGTVYISVSSAAGTICEVFDFGQPREKVIDRTANKCLELLQKEILKNVL